MNSTRYRFLVAVHLLLIRDGQVLLLRRFNTGYEDGNYSVIAGHVEEGEDVKTAVAREALEEAGISLLHQDLRVTAVMERKSIDGRIDFFLAADAWHGVIRNCEPDKCDELRWFPMDALPENTIPYIRRALDNFRNEQWFDSFGWS
jgi:8-oxo-dGTP diphosphatase